MKDTGAYRVTERTRFGPHLDWDSLPIVGQAGPRPAHPQSRSGLRRLGAVLIIVLMLWLLARIG